VATLLTGVGYIGAALVRRLAQAQERGPVVALDNFFCTSPDQVNSVLPSGTRLIEGDVADPLAVARAFDALGPTPDGDCTVYHLAAQPSAAVAARDPDVTERSNLVGARVVLQAAYERGARVVFGGSFRVYGDDLVGQTVCEDRPYGRVGDLSHLSKIYVEQLARSIGVRFVSTRLGVTYGLSPIMKTDPAFMTVPNLFCKRAVEGQVLQVLEDRPMAFIQIEDAADALIASATLLAKAATPWQVVNAAPEVATIGQVARVVQHLAEARGTSVRIDGAASSEAVYQVRSRLDESGFTPRHSLAGDLGEVVDWFLGLGSRDAIGQGPTQRRPAAR
jgi:nucleoside-diphosphate-sugar epimerase